jgi:hypothetical protein
MYAQIIPFPGCRQMPMLAMSGSTADVSAYLLLPCRSYAVARRDRSLTRHLELINRVRNILD